MKYKLWRKIFSAAIARSFVQVRPLTSHHSPSQQTCGTWGGSSVPHWDTNTRSLSHCRGRGQYLQYPHRYWSDWKLENSGQAETDDSCEMKKNVNLTTRNWLKLGWENVLIKISWWSNNYLALYKRSSRSFWERLLYSADDWLGE